jgi:diguanylate cyclase (GGDEF)-like protein
VKEGQPLSSPSPGTAVQRAQRLRLARTSWACASYLGLILIVLAYVHIGVVSGERATEYIAMVILSSLAIIGLIVSGTNLRLHDPSMTTAQVIVPMLPSLYIMYFITDSHARTVFLFMAVVQPLFGAFALDFRRLLLLAVFAVLSYAALVAVLAVRHQEVLGDLRIEALVVAGFAMALGLSAYVGSVIGGLRRRLRQRNLGLEELAARNPLTRLPNRRSIMARLASEGGRSERLGPAQSPLCVCMLDVDHFKRINDTYGHQVGDAVLRRIGECLRETLRPGDFAGRFGGEEFLLILPLTSLEGACRAAERVREAVAGSPMPKLPDTKRVTVSIGVAAHESGSDPEATLLRADKALYRAKRDGRNQVASALAAESPRG